MEQATFAAPSTLELRVRTPSGSLTSTQIEAIADAADVAALTHIELTPDGELVLDGIGASAALRARAGLAEAGLRVAEAHSGAAASELPRAETGLQHIELTVPAGTVTPRHLRDLARLARTYADCELRVTPARNLVILNMPRANLSLMLREPVLRELPVRE